MGTQSLPAHVAWPTFYSAKSEIAIAREQLRAAVTIEIPLVDLVLAFNQYYADRDLVAEIRAGNIESLEDAFRAEQFRLLGAGLELEIDGMPASGAWLPADTPINGRATEGFFAYILEFRFTEPPELGREVTVTVRNHLFPEVDIVFADLVYAEGPWTVARSSIPQPPPEADLSPGSPDEIALWSSEPERRHFAVTLRRD